MSRSDGSARPTNPPDSDAHLIRGIFGDSWGDDEAILMPQAPEQAAALDDALWPLLGGEVIQPHCMCGKWSSVAECPDCSRERQEMQDDAAKEERNYRERAAWRNFKKPGAAA